MLIYKYIVSGKFNDYNFVWVIFFGERNGFQNILKFLNSLPTVFRFYNKNILHSWFLTVYLSIIDKLMNV